MGGSDPLASACRVARDGRWCRGAFWSVLALFLLFAGVAWTQANRSRQIVRQNYGDDLEWEQEAYSEGVVYWRGRLAHHISMPSAKVKGRTGQPPSLRVAIPYSRWGYVLNLSTRKVEKGARMPSLDFLVNDTLLGSVQIARHYPKSRKTRDCREVMVPARVLNEAEDNYLVVRNAAGGGWQGRLLLIKYGVWRPILMFVLPLAGCLVLALSVRMDGRRWDVARPLLVFAVFFFVYYYTVFSKKMAPIGGFFLARRLHWERPTPNPMQPRVAVDRLIG